MRLRKKIMQMPKWAVAVTGILIAAVFLGLSDLTGFLLKKVPSLPGYGNSMIAELISGVIAGIFLLLFGYGKVLREKGVGAVKSLYIGGFLTGYCFLELVAQFYVQVMSRNTKVVNGAEIGYFVATMLLIGWTEEVVFRGLILNIFLDRFSKTKKGILAAVILSGVIFGAAHVTNIFTGVTAEAAMVQAVTAAVLGVLFGAVYVRSGNLWLVMLYHTLVDFASLMSSGIWGMGTSLDGINEISVQNLIAVPVLLIPCMVLLRPQKLGELEQRANNIVVFDTWQEAHSNAVTSLILGILSLLIGVSGYGIGIAVTGICGAILSRNYQKQGNGIALAGLITSLIGLLLGLMSVAGMSAMLGSQFLGIFVS